MVKTGWIVRYLRRDWSPPRDRVLTPKFGPDSKKRIAGSPCSPRPSGNSPFTTAITLFTPHTAPPSLARSLTRADYTGRLQRCRRSSWTAAATRTRTRPGTKRQRPTGGTRTRPRDITRPDNSIDKCHHRRAGQFGIPGRQWDVWSAFFFHQVYTYPDCLKSHPFRVYLDIYI